MTTIGLVLLSAPVLFGGVKRVAKVAEFVLPLMALAYVTLALIIVAMHIGHLPQVLGQIIGGAFDSRRWPAVHRRDWAAMLTASSGLFSNEAGMGSAPNVAATATVSHPVKQG